MRGKKQKTERVIPLCSLIIFSAQMSFPEFVATITNRRVVSSYLVSF